VLVLVAGRVDVDSSLGRTVAKFAVSGQVVVALLLCLQPSRCSSWHRLGASTSLASLIDNTRDKSCTSELKRNPKAFQVPQHMLHTSHIKFQVPCRAVRVQVPPQSLSRATVKAQYREFQAQRGEHQGALE
jgi:hypothetical protein